MEIVNIIILEATDMLCNYNTEKLLGLKGVIVKNVRQLPDRTFFESAGITALSVESIFSKRFSFFRGIPA